jgi:hypothetical protein
MIAPLGSAPAWSGSHRTPWCTRFRVARSSAGAEGCAEARRDRSPDTRPTAAQATRGRFAPWLGSEPRAQLHSDLRERVWSPTPALLLRLGSRGRPHFTFFPCHATPRREFFDRGVRPGQTAGPRGDRRCRRAAAVPSSCRSATPASSTAQMSSSGDLPMNLIAFRQAHA